jgi:signal peptidase I
MGWEDEHSAERCGNVLVPGLPMNVDMSVVLLVVLAVAGTVLLVDLIVWKPRRKVTVQGGPAREPLAVSYARSLFPILLIVVLFRTFLFEPFRIPSASMMPGLVDGDFILVNKFTYGLRLPVFNTKVLSIGEPRRGDVIVFRAPAEPINLIKRLVGLPGDHVEVRSNQVFINGQAIPLAPDGSYEGGYGFTGSELRKERFGATEHVIMLAPDRFTADFDGIVPAGHYFFMGDNRNDSEDSRFAKVGFVAEDRLVGRALRIWMNWRIPGWPDFRRVGLPIQ